MSLNLALSFLAGLATFFSPCILPIIPGYLAVLSVGQKGLTKRVLFFVIGLAFSFTVLGALVGWVGGTVVPLRDDLIRILGVILTILGLNLIWPLPLGVLKRDWQFRIKGSTDWSALLLGGAFGIAWTPCSGVILGAIIAQALLLQTEALPLLLAYSTGLILPMIGLAIFFERTGRTLRVPPLVGRYYGPVLGVLMIILGISLMTGWIDLLRGALLSIAPDFERGLIPFTR